MLITLLGADWTWPDASEGEWEVVTDGYQQFYEHWRNTCTGSNFPNKFPYKLSLGVDPGGIPLPFRPYSISRNQIVVTRSYEEMFHRLLRLRSKDHGSTRGVVLTGQPGIGASLCPDSHHILQLISASVLQEKLPS